MTEEAARATRAEIWPRAFGGGEGATQATLLFRDASPGGRRALQAPSLGLAGMGGEGTGTHGRPSVCMVE